MVNLVPDLVTTKMQPIRGSGDEVGDTSWRRMLAIEAQTEAGQPRNGSSICVGRCSFTMSNERCFLLLVALNKRSDVMMSIDWIPRLRGHVDLVKRLVTEVPRALDRPGLTLEHAKRLHTAVKKGARDLNGVIQLMNGLDFDEYRVAAESLVRIWSHLADATADKIQMLQNEANAESG